MYCAPQNQCNINQLLQKQALELSMGMSGDFEQAIAMCVVVVHAQRGLCQQRHLHRNSGNSEFIILMHYTFRGASNVRLGSTIFGAR